MAYEKFRMEQEAGKCLLCYDAPCKKVCPEHMPVNEIIRSVRFDNTIGAAKKITASCKGCSAPCVEACNLKKVGVSLEIPQLMQDVTKGYVELSEEKKDLSIEFCGVLCENPFFLSSSVVGSNYEMVAKAFEMGWAGVAFKTIGTFVPNEVSPRFSALQKENTPFVGFKNIEQISDHSLEENVKFLKQLKEEFPTKVIIASIMGQNEEEWTYLAKIMEDAGADIIECNFSCPQMVGEGLGSDVGTNLELVEKYTAATKRGTTLPILAKMTPNITRMEDAAIAAKKGGAGGIAAINTIKSIMNVSLDNYQSEPNVSGKTCIGGYSGKAVKPIALRFIHDMKKCQELSDMPISGMGGIETWKDAVEFMTLGCETIQITTAVMQYGYRIIDDLIEGLNNYMILHKIDAVKDIVGKALEFIVSTDSIDRDTIEYPKFLRKECIQCGRCYISCYDGGHQAIEMDEISGQPKLLPKKCVGCQLCKLVCPVGAITSGTRIRKKENGR